MIRSMTGFGAAAGELKGSSVTVELRSVNSRHLKLSFRLPEGAESWEPGLRERIAARIHRGYVEVRVSVDEVGSSAPRIELDEPRAEAFLEAIETLRTRYGLSGGSDLPLLLQFGGVLREAETGGLEARDGERVLEAVNGALDGLLEMREREGERLEADLRKRLSGLRAGADEVKRLAPARLERERERLRAAVAELVEGAAVDEDRLAREIALVADRWDIGEELVRTRSHLDAFEEYLEAPAAEPVGKRLSFLVQELQREINTMGAKANDAEISRVVVEMKNEVERLREQVENVE